MKWLLTENERLFVHVIHGDVIKPTYNERIETGQIDSDQFVA